MKSLGIDVISLSTGEPDFPTPDVVKAAATEAILANFTRYTQSEGFLGLREAISQKFTAENNIPCTPSRVLVSNGGKHTIFNALLALVEKGDEVLIPSPYWTSYPELVRIAEAEPVVMPTLIEDGFRIDPDQLRRAITPRTRAVILNSPSNPSGVMYSEEELRSLAEVIAETGIYVISDELYEKIIYDGNRHFSIGSIPELADVAITVNGVSKAFSMTGWRIGYMTGPQDVVAAAATMQSQTTSSASSISQRAALAALTSITDEVDAMVERFRERRDLIEQEVLRIPGVSYPRPQGAFYLLIDIRSYLTDSYPDTASVASYLLTEHHVATVPGSAFGAEGTLRLSYACSDSDILKGVERIASGLMEIRSGRTIKNRS